MPRRLEERDRDEREECNLPPSPYTLRDLIIKMRDALRSHTEADDRWRNDVMKLVKERLGEKDQIIDILKEERKYAELDKKRLYKIVIISLLGVLLLAGVKVAELVGLIGQ